MIALQILLTSLVTFLVYGGACLFVIRRLQQSQRRHKVAIGVTVFLVLWLPCMFVGGVLATVVPLQWGHAGEAYLLTYFFISIPIFGFSIAALYTDRPVDTTRGTETIEVICSNCRRQVSVETPTCPHCGFQFS